VLEVRHERYHPFIVDRTMKKKAKYPNLPKPENDRDTCAFIAEWSDWFYEHTNTFTGALGRQLAYLWPAVVKDHQVEVSSRSAIVKLLREHKVPGDLYCEDYNAIWYYFDVVVP